jgi:hypothetical protein
MRIKLGGHVLMFGDVLLTRPRGDLFGYAWQPGGDECTVAKIRQPSDDDAGRVETWDGRRSADGQRLLSSFHPAALSAYFTLADAPY